MGVHITNYQTNIWFKIDSRVLYVTFDATDYLKKGRNAVGVMLGHGWYSRDGSAPGRTHFADHPILMLQMEIEFTDGTRSRIVSDATWKAASGPIRANDMCVGETHDAWVHAPTRLR